MKIIITKNEVEKVLTMMKESYDVLDDSNVTEEQFKEALEKFKIYKFRKITSVNYNEDTQEYSVEINEDFVVDYIDTIKPIAVKSVKLIESFVNMIKEFALPRIVKFTNKWFIDSTNGNDEE